MNTQRCCPTRNREITDAPRPTGRITVAIPAANTSVMPTSCTRRWKLVAKYAGSSTEMQHGASSATSPPRKAVITVPDTSRWPTRRNSPQSVRHRSSLRPAIVADAGRPCGRKPTLGPGSVA